MITEIEIMQHNLKLIRKILDFSAADLAEELGCTRQSIQQLESGHHGMKKNFLFGDAVDYTITFRWAERGRSKDYGFIVKA